MTSVSHAAVQVNIDFESEQDMVEKARIGLALQPVATALFANSPFRDGKPTGQHACAVCLASLWFNNLAHLCGLIRHCTVTSVAKWALAPLWLDQAHADTHRPVYCWCTVTAGDNLIQCLVSCCHSLYACLGEQSPHV